MPSFDVVSRTDLPEVGNAVQGAMREISTRYDFKGSNCSIERDEHILTIRADDDYKLQQVQEMLRGHMAKRKVDIGFLDYGEPEKASGNTLRQTVTVKQGIERELAQYADQYKRNGAIAIGGTIMLGTAGGIFVLADDD